jgi:hypothetical protein
MQARKEQVGDVDVMRERCDAGWTFERSYEMFNERRSHPSTSTGGSRA